MVEKYLNRISAKTACAYVNKTVNIVNFGSNTWVGALVRRSNHLNNPSGSNHHHLHVLYLGCFDFDGSLLQSTYGCPTMAEVYNTSHRALKNRKYNFGSCNTYKDYCQLI